MGIHRFTTSSPQRRPIRLSGLVSQSLATVLATAILAFGALHLPCGSADEALADQGIATFKPGPEDLQHLTPLFVTAARFKETARTDFVKAMLTHASADGRERLNAIDTTLWEPQQSPLGWMLFFNSAVRVHSGKPGRFPVVGYYNPFSDMVLITAWKKDKALYRIVDAEMVMGDWLRDRSADLDVVPLWLRERVHRPVALGASVAETLTAFERVFAAADADNWREKLKILRSPEALDRINYPGAALMLNDHMLGVLDFSNPEDDHTPFAICRRLTVEVMEAAGRGEIKSFLRQADHTPGETAQALGALGGQWYAPMKVAAALSDPEGCLVLLSSPEQTNGSLCLYFAQSSNRFHLKRIDFVDYQQFYGQLRYKRSQQEKGGVH